ncbi:hypothetical protein SAMN05444680_102313 [Variovorax sp. YR216]|nr:hypothetical protein SAMN05444680_102313 [Variovorax sp. YR216]
MNRSRISSRSLGCRVAEALAVLFAVLLSAFTCEAAAEDLRILIVRHGEKPQTGDNLSCQGENRALALPAVLMKKFGRPGLAYVPKLETKASTRHARMFQTVTPFAIQQDLTVNSKYAEEDVTGAAQDVLQQTGLVLMVWEHTQIPPLAKALGVKNPPSWRKDDFDSIWVVTPSGGVATLTTTAEGLKPSPKCSF